MKALCPLTVSLLGTCLELGANLCFESLKNVRGYLFLKKKTSIQLNKQLNVYNGLKELNVIFIL